MTDDDEIADREERGGMTVVALAIIVLVFMTGWCAGWLMS